MAPAFLLLPLHHGAPSWPDASGHADLADAAEFYAEVRERDDLARPRVLRLDAGGTWADVTAEVIAACVAAALADGRRPFWLRYETGTDADMTPEDWRAWRVEERAKYRRQEAA